MVLTLNVHQSGSTISCVTSCQYISPFYCIRSNNGSTAYDWGLPCHTCFIVWTE